MKKSTLAVFVTGVLLLTLAVSAAAQVLQKPALQTTQKPPSVTSFKINNDASATGTRGVTLNNTVSLLSGSPAVTEYRASERSDFSGAMWLAYSTAPAFNISDGLGVKTIYFQVKNNTGLSNIMSDAITYAMLPRVTFFKVNNDAAVTLGKAVTLSSMISGTAAWAYRAGEKSDLSDAPWSGYKTDVPFTLSPGEGTKTVYFQVRDEPGSLSNIMSDTIVSQERQLYTINADDFDNYARTIFISAAIKKDPTSNCDAFGGPLNTGFHIQTYSSQAFGSKCDFTIWGAGTLKNGFVFKSFTGEKRKQGDPAKSDCYLTAQPTAGSNTIRFAGYGWAGAHGLISSGRNFCEYNIKTITLEGPTEFSVITDNKPWINAIR